MYYRANALPKRKIHFGFWLGFACVLAFMLGWAIEGWGHSVNDTITGYEWQDYDCEHRMHYGYDIHHEHTTGGDDWHWHKRARNDNGDLLESYINEHEHDSDYNRNHADAWTSMGCSNEENADREDSGNNPSVPPAEVEVVTPEYPVQPVVDTVKPTTPVTPTTPTIAPMQAAYLGSTGPERHFYDFSEGDSRFIGLPVLPLGVETVKDLWKAFRAEFKNDISFQLMANSVWQTSYRGEDNELGETAVTPHLGINVGINSWITLRGVPILGEQIELSRGVHFVGLPEIPMLYKRPSDLLSDKVAWVHVKKDRTYPYIYGEGDEGNDLFYAGQAFVIRVVEDMTLDLRGNEVAAAPMAPRQGTLATSWGAMKR